ncbi:MAG: cytochrome b/b6 domain-containing protein [Deltaproteobacteria bacterium]|nr:cytochrome b/b6 domain-containing protein [Deltaproteobacteria bacterium]
MAHEHVSETQVTRFSVLHRLLHWPVMIGFIGLGLSGFSLYFSDQWWARGLTWLVGGGAHLAWWHRFFAVITYFSVLSHLGWVVYYRLVLKQPLTGSESMLPRAEDFTEFWQHIKYLFAKGDKPKFGKFTYWEKVDYFAVVVGMNTMGLTGLVLWFPEWFTGFLPGWVVNAALVLHLYEAIIAVALKFVVHIYTAHFRPPVFPMEHSIFSGKVPLEELKHERPAQWEALTSPQGEEDSAQA